MFHFVQNSTDLYAWSTYSNNLIAIKISILSELNNEVICFWWLTAWMKESPFLDLKPLEKIKKYFSMFDLLEKKISSLPSKNFSFSTIRLCSNLFWHPNGDILGNLGGALLLDMLSLSLGVLHVKHGLKLFNGKICKSPLPPPSPWPSLSSSSKLPLFCFIHIILHLHCRTAHPFSKTFIVLQSYSFIPSCVLLVCPSLSLSSHFFWKCFIFTNGNLSPIRFSNLKYLKSQI